MHLVVVRGNLILDALSGVDDVEAAEVADALSEILGSYAAATPAAGRRLMLTFDVLARRCSSLDELTRALDTAGVRAGQLPDGELAALLLDSSDSIRDALARAEAARTERENP